MFDNIAFWDFVEGISEVHFKSIKSFIYPNPASDNFTIEFDNPHFDLFELSIYDIRSKLILKKENISDNKITLDGKSFFPGTYVYKLTNFIVNSRSWGKFVINK